MATDRDRKDRSSAPLTPEQYVHLAVRFYKAGKFDEAFTACEAAIQLDPMCARAYHGKGLILAKEGMHSGDDCHEALECYQKSCQLEPNNAKLYADLGELLFWTCDYAIAGSTYRKAIEIDKKFERDYKNYIDLLIEDGFGSISGLERALLFDPFNEKVKYYLSCQKISYASYLTFNDPPHKREDDRYEDNFELAGDKFVFNAKDNNEWGFISSPHVANCRCSQCQEY